MATYVFIAGAWHGSWCWSEVKPMLEDAGHRVLTPDLIGMEPGVLETPARPISAWADQISDILRAERDPVILVGHSRAGLVISEVAERVPEKIGLLVYLSAFLLKDGETLDEIARAATNNAALSQSVTFRDDGTSVLTPEGIERFFYNKTPEHFVQVARERTVAEPAAAFVTPIHVTDQRFGSVMRAYIECAHDNAVPLSTQRAMQEATPVAITAHLDSDHSPFFSAPSQLVETLEAVRRRADETKG
jgi:pimeloyl-ACP methyl ester carboxylesterase